MTVAGDRPPPSVEGDSDPWVERSPVREIRFALAGLLVLGLAVLAVASYLPWFGIQSCRQEANTGAAVMVCQPVGPADLPGIGLVLLVAVVLIWPEVSELGFAGVSLNKRLRTQERKQRETDTTVGNLVLAQPVPKAAELRKEREEARQERVSGHRVPSAAGTRVLSDERVNIESKLLRFVTALDSWVGLLRSPKARRALLRDMGWLTIGGLQMKDLLESQLLRWQAEYSDQLRLWGAIRNEAVHYPERLSDEEVREGIALGELLIEGLARIAGASDGKEHGDDTPESADHP